MMCSNAGNNYYMCSLEQVKGPIVKMLNEIGNTKLHSTRIVLNQQWWYMPDTHIVQNRCFRLV